MGMRTRGSVGRKETIVAVSRVHKEPRNARRNEGEGRDGGDGEEDDDKGGIVEPGRERTSAQDAGAEHEGDSYGTEEIENVEGDFGFFGYMFDSGFH